MGRAGAEAVEGEAPEGEAGRKARVRREERKAYWRRVCARGRDVSLGVGLEEDRPGE